MNGFRSHRHGHRARVWWWPPVVSVVLLFTLLGAPGTAQAAVPRIMVVGDSISQGSAGDYTWRYRLYQHLGAGNVDMVGPDNKLFDNVAQVQGDSRYADPAFDSDHDALWGRAALQEKETIAAEVSSASPDYLLVLLGVNDLAWLTDAATAEASLRSLITNARSAKADVRVVLGKVLPTSRATTDSAFAAKVTDLNTRIATIVRTMSTATSPVALAETTTGFVAANDTYDGVHPNARGEVKIAAAFADALAAKFGVGSAYPRPLPSPPIGPLTAPTLTVANGNRQATLSWTASPGATGYWVWTRNVTAGEAWHRLPIPLTLANSPWVSALLANGGTYEYKLQTQKGNDNGVYSNVVTARPTGTSPAGATLTVSSGNGSATLSWEAVPNATDYVVWTRNVTANEAWRALPYPLPVSYSPWTTTGLANGGTYEYKLESLNGYQHGSFSNVVRAQPHAPDPVGTTLSITNGNRSATLRWTAVPNATGYMVWTRNLSLQETVFRQLPYPVTGTSWTSTGLIAGSTVEYMLQSVSGYQTGGFSNVATAKPTGTPPAAPTLTYTASGTTVKLDWNAVANATLYDVYSQDQITRYEDFYNNDTLFTSPTTTTHQATVDWGATVKFKVLPRNGFLGGPYSNIVRVRRERGDYNSIAAWMTTQVNTNVQGSDVAWIKQKMVQGDPASIGLALFKWSRLVCTGCVWDHKPFIRTNWKDRDPFWSDIPGTSDKIYYDVWSNIHYGFIGRACSIGRSLLLNGSHSAPGAGLTDPGDDVSVTIGMDLFDTYGANGFTQARLDAALRARFGTYRSVSPAKVRGVDVFG